MNFDQLIQEIMKHAKISRDELMARINQKREELGALVTPEGLAMIVGRELGVELKQKEVKPRELKIGDLVPGMSNVDLLARVIRIYEPRSFPRWDGSLGHVAGMVLQDESGSIRAVLWDNKASLVGSGAVQKGDAIRIKGAYVQERANGQAELHIGARSSVEVTKEPTVDSRLPPLKESTVKIAELKQGLKEVDVLGRVVAVSEIKTFDRSDGTTDKVASLVLMDETGKIRVSLWGEKAELTKELRRGDVIMVENASVRVGLHGKPELNVGGTSRVLVSPDSPQVKKLPEIVERLLKLEELETDMPSIDVVARVRRKFPVLEFKRDDGSKGRVASLVLEDETSLAKASFWDNASEVAERVVVGDVLLLRGAYTKTGLTGKPEIHVGRSTKIEINPPNMEVGRLKPSKVMIGELEPGMDALEVLGRVIEVGTLREFTKEGEKGKVITLSIGDRTGVIRTSLWHEHAEKAKSLKTGDVIILRNAYTTVGLFGQTELHVGRAGEIEINPPVDEEIPPAEVLSMVSASPEIKTIQEIDKPNVRVRVRGTIVRVLRRRPTFDVCPICGRSLGSVDTNLFCEECGKVVSPERRVVLSVILDDGTGSMRAVFFGKVAEELAGMESKRIFETYRSNSGEFHRKLGLEGREVTLTGVTRYDKYSDQLELRVSAMESPDAREEANRLLEKVKVGKNRSTGR